MEPPIGESRFRYDIQGLRAVAVLLVAFDHADLLHLTGGYIGVDVFFVISGYLITQWLLKEKSRTGRIAYRRFYAARARRILPAAALTLVATDIACAVLFNPIRAQSTLNDSVWAVFFAANVHFAHIGTDYLSSTLPPSPLQHFWSLAVEEQFYLVWPALLMLVVYLLRRPSLRKNRQDGESLLKWQRLRSSPEARVAITLGVIVIASFAWSVIETSEVPAAAYFSTFTRAWELGIGAILVVSEKQILRLPLGLRVGATWVGLIAILSAAFIYTSNTEFPGFAAAVPVLGAALIIAGGMGSQTKQGPKHAEIRRSPRSAGLVLGRQPFVYIGDVSYTFYLWHWPVLIVAEEYIGHSLPAISNFLLLVLAFSISVVTFQFYENPIRRGAKLQQHRWAFLWVWAGGLASVLLVSAFAGQALTTELAAREASASVIRTQPATTQPVKKGTSSPVSTTTTTVISNPYIAAVAASVTPSTLASPVPGGLTPPYQDLANDLGPQHVVCGASTDTCPLGDTSSGRVLVALGNSHVTQWLSPLISYATSRHMRLDPFSKSACYPADATSKVSDSCSEWYASALQEVAQLKPAAILLIQQFGPGVEAKAIETEVADLKKISPVVIVFEDTPILSSDPTNCLLQAARLGYCVGSESEGQTNKQLQSDAPSLGFDFLPTRQWFCYNNICPAVIGHTIAYMNTAHVSNEYASDLTTPLSQELDGFLG